MAIEKDKNLYLTSIYPIKTKKICNILPKFIIYNSNDMILINLTESILQKSRLFHGILILFLFLLPINVYSSQTILLKNGRTISGTILEHNEKKLTIKLENGNSETIEKKKILKVVYKELSKDEERKIRISEEQNLLEAKLNLGKEIIASQKNPETILNNQEYNNQAQNQEIPIHLFTVQGKDCTMYSSQTHWFWLYGNLSISTIKWSTILPQEKKLIQIRWDSNWKDNLISIFLGTLTSISRKTLTIEICELGTNLKKSTSKK